jgi:nicotinamidase-related amidase
MLEFTTRRQELVFEDGFRVWKAIEEKQRYRPEETAFIIVDMWDLHWSAGFSRRCAVLAEKINAAACRVRTKGILIVHAPSDTADFYRDTEARKRILLVPQLKNIPDIKEIKDYPLPIDDSDGGSDSESGDSPPGRVWTRQIEKIHIDQNRDIICGDEGDIFFSYLKAQDIKCLIYTGVAMNMCVLNRSFGIKKMLRRGLQPLLVRDLTEVIYNPAMPPYVSHEEANGLVSDYIEKFYCPSIDGGQL